MPSARGVRGDARTHRRADRPALGRTRSPWHRRRHHRVRDERQRCIARGRHDGHMRHVPVLQRSEAHGRAGHRPPGSHRDPAVEQQLSHRLGPGRQHALEALQAGHPRGRCPRPPDRAVVEGHTGRVRRRHPAPVPSRDRHRADDLRAPRSDGADIVEGSRPEAGRGHEPRLLLLPGSRRRGRGADDESVAVLRDARSSGYLGRRMEGRFVPSSRNHDRRRRLGALSPRCRLLRVQRPR